MKWDFNYPEEYTILTNILSFASVKSEEMQKIVTNIVIPKIATLVDEALSYAACHGVDTFIDDSDAEDPFDATDSTSVSSIDSDQIEEIQKIVTNIVIAALDATESSIDSDQSESKYKELDSDEDVEDDNRSDDIETIPPLEVKLEVTSNDSVNPPHTVYNQSPLLTQIQMFVKQYDNDDVSFPSDADFQIVYKSDIEPNIMQMLNTSWIYLQSPHDGRVNMFIRELEDLITGQKHLQPTNYTDLRLFKTLHADKNITLIYKIGAKKKCVKLMLTNLWWESPLKRVDKGHISPLGGTIIKVESQTVTPPPIAEIDTFWYNQLINKAFWNESDNEDVIIGKKEIKDKFNACFDQPLSVHNSTLWKYLKSNQFCNANDKRSSSRNVVLYSYERCIESFKKLHPRIAI